MKAKNISSGRVKVEYGFLKIRKRELLNPGQVIEIDQFDFDYLNRLGVFRSNEMAIVSETETITETLEDKMAKAKKDVEQYINQK